MKHVDCDVLVIGSGAGGLSTAVVAAHAGLRVLVVEKSSQFGGTTARSGGWLWIPGTALAVGHGIRDEDAGLYLQQEAGGSFDAKRVAAFLEGGPKAVEFFVRNTAVQFDMPPVFPDYHAESQGGKPGGRSMVTRPLDARELGSRLKDLAGPLPELTVFGMMLGSGPDIIHFMRASRSFRSAWYVAKRLSRHFLQVARHGRGMLLTNGNALAGRLAKSAFDAGVELWLSSSATCLIQEDGRVAGADIEQDGAPVRVRASRGVVLACGGFPQDPVRRARLFPHVRRGAEHVSPSPSGNVGDGLRLGESVGAYVDVSLPNAAAWVPVSRLRRPDGSIGVMPHFIDRAKPGVIAVLPNGRRFTDESCSYHDFVQAMLRHCTDVGAPKAFLVCDHRAIRRYGLGSVRPFPFSLAPYLHCGYLHRAKTVAELAAKLGVPSDALQEAVRRFNTNAALGDDPEFAKGSTAYGRFQGDATHGPNPCIAPLNDGPFYAIEVGVGDLGTFAGLKVDEFCRPTRSDGTPIAGLYAVGNDSLSIMGGAYPGAGITLGPALTFGYIAGSHLVKQPSDAEGHQLPRGDFDAGPTPAQAARPEPTRARTPLTST